MILYSLFSLENIDKASVCGDEFIKIVGKMTRDNEIPAIFNPRVRAPSVVVTGDSPNSSFVDGGNGFTNILHTSNPQISRLNSLSQPENLDNVTCVQVPCNNVTVTVSKDASPSQPFSHVATTVTLPTTSTSTTVNASNATTVTISTTIATTTAQPPTISQTTSSAPALNATPSTEQPPRKFAKLKESCCSESAKKMYFGVCVTILITATWVGATHCIKFLYIRQNMPLYGTSTIIDETDVISANDNFFFEDFDNETNDLFEPLHITDKVTPKKSTQNSIAMATQNFNAPFFTAWFCTNLTLLFFPIYLLGRMAFSKTTESPGETLGNIVRGFRDRGFTATRFLHRCFIFGCLWLMTLYLFILSLRALLATDVIALFATNVACAYLLSWVILHEQFVGIRVSLLLLEIFSEIYYILFSFFFASTVRLLPLFW